MSPQALIMEQKAKKEILCVRRDWSYLVRNSMNSAKDPDLELGPEKDQ